MPISTAEDVAKAKSAYDFVVYDAKKQEFDMAQRRGRPTLISNIAMKCGLAANAMACLTKIYHTFKDQDVLVLGFPSSEFNNQNPGDEAETVHEACSRFKSDFPIMKKIEVNGDNANPLWKWMKKEKAGFLGTQGIKWNFTFFLLDQDGQVYERFGPGPSYESVEKAVLAVLKKGETAAAASSFQRGATFVDSSRSMHEIEVGSNNNNHDVGGHADHDESEDDKARSLLAGEKSEPTNHQQSTVVNNNNNNNQQQQQKSAAAVGNRQKMEPQPKEKTCCCC